MTSRRRPRRRTRSAPVNRRQYSKNRSACAKALCTQALHRGLDSGSLFPRLRSLPSLNLDVRSSGKGSSPEASGGAFGPSAAGKVACGFCGNTEIIMSKQYGGESGTQPEIRKTSDRLMVILGQALVEELEKAQQEGESILSWQFGSLDALTKHLSGSLAAIVTLLKGLNPPQKDFVLFRQRVHRQLESAVLALLNVELAKVGAQGKLPWPHEGEKGGHA